MDARSSPTVSVSGGPEPNSLAPPSSLGAAPQYSIETVTTEEGLASLEDDWNRLSDTAAFPNAFMTFDWFRAWNQRFTQEAGGARRRLHVLVLKKDGRTTGISPLIHRTAARFGWAVRKLEFAGPQADYNDLVLGSDPEGQAEAIAGHFVRTRGQRDLVDLRDLRATGTVLPRLQAALRGAGLICRLLPEKQPCPYLNIDGGSSETLAKLSPGFRRGFLKRRRRIERMRAEGLRIRVIENPQSEPGLLARLVALDSQKHPGGKSWRPFIALYRDVFQSLFETLGPRGWLYVALMELGDRLLAFQFGFRCGKKLWGYRTAYDHAFARLSPGAMFIPALIDYGFSHGYTEYDFLRGEERYKKWWARGSHRNYRLLVWSREWTARARAFVYLDLKSAVYRLFGKGE